MAKEFVSTSLSKWQSPQQDIGAFIATTPQRKTENPALLQSFDRFEIIDSAAAAHLTLPPYIDLTETERLGAAAFALRQSEAFKGERVSRQSLGQPWNFPAGHSNDKHPDAAPDGHIQPAPGKLPNDRLGGSIAVGLIFVNGPGNLAFSESQKTKALAEIQSGFEFLQKESKPANISWHFSISSPAIATANTYPSGGYEAMEKPWRDAALAALNLSGGAGGISQFVERNRTQLGTQRTICIFMTKYRTAHYAYADKGARYLVFSCDSSGGNIPGNLDAVCAHEACHLFSAPDEYIGDPQNPVCKCGGSHGIYGKPNITCEACGPGAAADCLMRVLSFELCIPTRFHLGFPDPGNWPAGV